MLLKKLGLNDLDYTEKALISNKIALTQDKKVDFQLYETFADFQQPTDYSKIILV